MGQGTAKRCAIDIGGSSIKRAVVAVTGTKAEVLARGEPLVLSSREFEEVRSTVIRAVRESMESRPGVTDVAISTTGAVDRTGRVISAGHFHGYKNIDWDAILQAGVPEVTSVTVANDGIAATWAEYVANGQGGTVFANFVVGTGVGGGIVCDEAPLYGDDDGAGSLGHMKVALESDLKCSCRRYGCLEPQANADAVVRYFRSRATSVKLPVHDPFGFVISLARAGDERARGALQDAGEWLGLGIATVINVLNPRAITLGGGVVVASASVDDAGDGPLVAAAIKSAKERAFEGMGDWTSVRRATSGNDGGLLGAALLSVAKRA